MDQTNSATFNPRFLGRGGYTWWIGQIAKEETWKENIPGKPVQSNDEMRGFGERYRVRIMGYHTDDCNEVADDELPWAYVQYPPTAGGGGRSSFASANLAQGNFVQGYFFDGPEGQVPIIVGVIGYNQYQAISKSTGSSDCEAFKPKSGYTEEEKIASYTVRAYPGGGEVAIPDDGITAAYTNNYYIEDMLGSNVLVDMASWDARWQGKKADPVAKTKDCEPMDTRRITKELQNGIQRLQELQRSKYDYRYALTNGEMGIDDMIRSLTRELCKLMASLFKDIIEQMEKKVLRETNNTLKKKYDLLHPSERPQLKKQVENANDQIACIFKKIISQLENLICQFLEAAAERVINVTECFVNNAMGNLLGALLGGLQGQINSALSGIGSLVDGVGVGEDLISTILQDPFSFLKCEEDNECGRVNEWSIWNGASNVANSANQLQGILGQANDVMNSFTGFGDALNNIFDNPGCDTGARPCGPPEARWIGSGSGALGNLIISAGGAIIGYDAIEFGSGYDANNTYGYAYDDCGNGNNGVFYPLVDEDGGIIDIVVEQGGTDYLPAPNGCTGGDGREWKCENDTEITHPGGGDISGPIIEVPIPPGNVIEVQPGDIVNTPCCSEVITEPIENDPTTGGETIKGCSTHVVQKPGRFTTPQTGCPGRTQGTYPSSSDGSYPVILYLCEIIIAEAGIAYQPGDEVVIQPDLGTAAAIEVDEQGRIIKVQVTEGGEGFKELPKVFVRSATGFNAELLPKFCVQRVGEDEVANPELQDKIVTVIDCVGKV